MRFPKEIWKKITYYKEDMERIDAFNLFLCTILSNLVGVLKSKNN